MGSGGVGEGLWRKTKRRFAKHLTPLANHGLSLVKRFGLIGAWREGVDGAKSLENGKIGAWAPGNPLKTLKTDEKMFGKAWKKFGKRAEMFGKSLEKAWKNAEKFGKAWKSLDGAPSS